MNLHLPDDLTGHASAVKLLLAQCPDKGPKVHKSSKVLKLESGGTTITQINAICKAIGRESCPDLIGASEAEAAQVEQWMSFVHTRFTPVTDDALLELNDVLAKRVFIVNNRLSIADICLYAALSSAVVAFPVAQQSTFCHILRWYDHIHHTIDATASSPPVCPAVSLPLASAPTMPTQSTPPAAKPRPDSAATSNAAPASSAASTGSKKAAASTDSKKAAAPATDSGSSKADAPSEGMSKKAAKKAAKKGGGGEAASAAPDDAAAAKKAERAAKNAAKNAPAPAAAAGPPSVDALDIRVGTITSVQKHPDADALYQEEIDIGEAAPRQVVSGLVKWVPQQEMQGRRVAVLVNLKPAKMRGVTSFGMVLCASTDNAVEPLAVPEGVPNGERVMVEGFAAEAEAQLNPKKKVLEALLPDMLTSADGVACFKGTPFNTSKGPLSSKIANAPVRRTFAKSQVSVQGSSLPMRDRFGILCQTLFSTTSTLIEC